MLYLLHFIAVSTAGIQFNIYLSVSQVFSSASSGQIDCSLRLSNRPFASPQTPPHALAHASTFIPPPQPSKQGTVFFSLETEILLIPPTIFAEVLSEQHGNSSLSFLSDVQWELVFLPLFFTSSLLLSILHESIVLWTDLLTSHHNASLKAILESRLWFTFSTWHHAIIPIMSSDTSTRGETNSVS